MERRRFLLATAAAAGSLASAGCLGLGDGGAPTPTPVSTPGASETRARVLGWSAEEGIPPAFAGSTGVSIRVANPGRGGTFRVSMRQYGNRGQDIIARSVRWRYIASESRETVGFAVEFLEEAEFAYPAVGPR